MSWMGLVSFLDACRAIVEVGAIHALVSDTTYILIMSVCNIQIILEDLTSSQPSQIAPWRMLRPGAQSLAAKVSRTVPLEAGSKAWLG